MQEENKSSRFYNKMVALNSTFLMNRESKRRFVCLFVFVIIIIIICFCLFKVIIVVGFACSKLVLLFWWCNVGDCFFVVK